jgi:phospholipid/cholesterol/gamma-HCH transport system permease protein
MGEEIRLSKSTASLASQKPGSVPLDRLVHFSQSVGEVIWLGFESVYWMRYAMQNVDKILRQMVVMGVSTLPIATVMSFFVGLVTALAVGEHLKRFGVEEWIGAVVGIAMTEQFGPVLTAFLVSGQVGSAITAEIGTMSVSEEVDALRTLAISPVRYLVMPRMIAGVVSMVALIIYADIVGMMGGLLIATSPWCGISANAYWDLLFDEVTLRHVGFGLLKGACFGFLIVAISCYMGLRAKGGASGVGQATTRTVVACILCILICNYFVTRILVV